MWTQVPPPDLHPTVTRQESGSPPQDAGWLYMMLCGYVCAKCHRKGWDDFHRNRYSGTFATSGV